MLRLEFVRRSQHLSQTTLAMLSGVSQQTISLLESGQGLPTAGQLLCLARALDVSPTGLLQPVRADEA